MSDRFAIAKRIVRLIEVNHPSDLLRQTVKEFADEFLEVTKNDEYYLNNQFDADLAARVLIKNMHDEMEKWFVVELRNAGFIQKLIWARHIKKSLSMLDELEHISEALWSEKSCLQLVSRQLWPTQRH